MSNSKNKALACFSVLMNSLGKVYRQLYGGRLVAENGKIKLLREFCDTVEVARAMFPNGVKDLVQKDKQ